MMCVYPPRDHLLMLEEQALRMSTWSRSLNKDWVNEQQHRMNVSDKTGRLFFVVVVVVVVAAVVVLLS